MSDQSTSDTYAAFDFVQEGNSLVEANYTKARTLLQLHATVAATWPCTVKDPYSLAAPADIVDEAGDGSFKCLWIQSEMIAVAFSGYGTAQVRVAAKTPEMARAFMKEIQKVLPKHVPADKSLIPVTFWAYTPEGPRATRRDLTAPTWAEIGEHNYAQETRERLAPLMTPEFRPGRSGQLILWHGKPGTGKTTALRALAQAWKDWAEIHYITDPDQFFGSHADYMLNTMLGAGSETDKPKDDETPRWRLLVLEDSGELLAKDARREIGAALSRFLNAVDGLIGQGLRVLTMVTTNEEIGALNEAVTRHGRAASEIEFAPLPPYTAAKLLMKLRADAEETLPREEADILVADRSLILADVYALAEERATPRPSGAKAKVGFG
jgi:hypothetical protein